MSGLPHIYRVAVLTRWGGWLAAVLLAAASGSVTRSESNLRTLLALIIATVYAVMWTRMLPRMMTRFTDGGVPILYDLLLSFVPVLIDGGWSSPFILLPLSVLTLPTLARGWRAGFPLAACFLALDQIVLWASTPNPLDLAAGGPVPSLLLIGRALLPFAWVGVTALTVAVVRRLNARSRRQRRSVARPQPFDISPYQSSAEGMRVPTAPPFDQPAGDGSQTARVWGKERTPQPTLERRRPATIRAALEHCRPELRAAGVAVTVDLPADERHDVHRLPPRVHDLLIRASEVALDNIVSHAHATGAKLVLRVDDDWATLLVEDDGIGLFDGTAEPPGFHQIKRLRFRASELGGELAVVERPEGGVRLHLRLPLVW